MKKKLAAIFLFFLISTGMIQAEEMKAEGRLKVGWVDLEKIFRGYYKTEKVLSKLEVNLKEKEAEIQKLIDRIQTLENEKGLLSESGRRKKDEEITEQKMALVKLRREAEIDLNNKIILEKEKLLEEIIAGIEKKGKAAGYTFIFRGELTVYQDPTLDLTDEILEGLNQGRESQEKEPENN